ncbi:MAG TPA: ribbon-helix-helix protein, CopG family [Firmicutes bacterium]|nr:ribbon-helix-helix protein, CopG family [Bacillota bacterium]
MIRTQVQLEEEQARALRLLAAARNVPVAELVRQAVDRYIRGAGMVDMAEVRKKAAAAAGRFRSGCRDVGRNHDEYLAEAYR